MSTIDNNYLTIFVVSESQLNSILKSALSKGGDYADLYFESSSSNEISLRDKTVSSAGYHIDFGMGIRVLNGEQTGYAYTEEISYQKMLDAAKIASSIALDNNKIIISPTDIKKSYNFKLNSRYSQIRPWDSISVNYKKELLNKIDEKIFLADERVVKVIARISDSESKILFTNSCGISYTDNRPMFSIAISVIMKQGSRTENASVSRSFRGGVELVSDNLIELMISEVINKCSFLFNASQPKGGQMSVVMGSGSSGILLHEAIGHAFEADFNRINTSIFSDKLGKKICPEFITVVDDPTIPYNRGSINIDDEGNIAQKTYMVKDGFLTSYLHDKISADFYKTEPTGNGRRESFRHMPLPRMTTTYMEDGNCKEEDLIKDVKKGVYVDNFSNGQVQIGVGDFTFYVKSGFLIENGKLTKPIKDINIIGNGPQALSDILGVANNLKIDNSTWTCGKEQYCAVSCGMPSILVNNLIVGGVE